MTDVPITAASGTLATGAAAAMSGLPSQEVILYAVIGGMVSVWLARQAEAVLTARWFAAALAQIGVSAAAGVTLSALVLAVAPGYAWLAPISAVPQWVLAGVIAALIHRAGPLMYAWFKRATGSKEEGGTPNA